MRVPLDHDTGIGEVMRVLQVEPIDGDPVPVPKRRRRPITAPALWSPEDQPAVVTRWKVGA